MRGIHGVWGSAVVLYEYDRVILLLALPLLFNALLFRAQ